MLSTPLRRGSFCVAILGAIALCAGAYDWLTTYPNTLLYRTTSIPNYPRLGDQSTRQSLVQIHRRCEWRDSPPPGANIFDYRGPVVLWDRMFSLDAPCAEKLLSLRSYNLAGVYLAFSNRSYQLMLREATRSASFVTPSGDENQSARALYQQHMVSEMVKVGVPHHDAARLLDKCTKTEATFCIEAQRYVYVNIWSVLWSTWPLAIGFVLFVAGLAGSILATPLAALWRASFGKIVNWIRRG